MTAATPEAVIGVDVGGSSTTLAVVYEGGIDTSTFEKYDTPSEGTEFIHELGTRVVRLAQRTGVDKVAAGIPGEVQWEGETPVSFGPTPNVAAFNVEAFKEVGPFDLVELLADEVPETRELEVVYFNDAHIVAQAAVRLMTPEGYRNGSPHVTILASTGVGGEALLDFRPIFRSRNTKGEYGHVAIGYPAISLENLASGTAIENRTGRKPEELATAEDPVAEATWKEVGEALAVGFGNLLALLDPDHMAFVGSVSAGAFHRFGPYLKARMHEIAWAGRAQNLEVPKLTPVTLDLVDQLPLRGTIWAYHGLKPLSLV